LRYRPKAGPWRMKIRYPYCEGRAGPGGTNWSVEHPSSSDVLLHQVPILPNDLMDKGREQH
ncbi:MAG: hypothetical protein ABI373_02500, partial [Flavobacteriales bacterium]